jgi:ferredoxin
MPQIDAAHCTGCGECVPACPTGALAPAGERAVLARPQACTYCARCEAVCRTGAIALPYQVVVEG